jgi:hypothetical protein
MNQCALCANCNNCSYDDYTAKIIGTVYDDIAQDKLYEAWEAEYCAREEDCGYAYAD